MKIGEKEYTPVYNNRRLYELEEAFDMPYGKIMAKGADLKIRELAIIIWHSIKEEMTFEEFTDTIRPSQYAAAETECVKALLELFEVKKK